MNIGSLEATLGINSDGLRKAEGDLRSFGSSANSTFGSAGSAAASCAGQLAAVAGVTLSLVGAFSLAQKAVSSWYSLVSGGISIVDDFKKQIISTSYIMTTMSDVKPPELSKSYSAWKDYFDWWYRASLDIDKRSAASQQEIFTLGIELAKKGVKVRQDAYEEDKNTIGRLTDLMKAVTPIGMDFGQQARGEVQALMEGMNKYGAQTAQILSQIDPAFKENIKNAREQGTVLKYIESILPQIKQYTLDLMGTWDAVGASLKSAWSVINIKAFGDAHREIVALATELSNKLTENGNLTAMGEQAARALGEAWTAARGYITEAMDYVLNNMPEIIEKIEAVLRVMGKVTGIAIDIGVGFLNVIDSISQFSMNVQVAMVQIRATVGYVIEWFEILGKTAKDVAHGIIWDFAEIGPAIDRAYASMSDSSNRWAGAAISDANAVRGALLDSMRAVPGPTDVRRAFGGPSDFEGYEAAGEGLRLRSRAAPPDTPGVRPFTGKGGKGGGGGGGKGGGADAEINRLNSLFDTLTKDIARLSEGKLSAIEADYNKTVENIFKKTSDRAHSEAEVEILAKTRKLLQEGKLQDDFNLKMAKDSGDVFLEIQKQYEKDLSDYKGLSGAKELTEANKAKRELDARQKFQEQVMGMQSASLSAMASAAPLLSQQIPIEKALLDIEIKRGNLKMEEELRVLRINHMISAGQEDELRGLKALEDQAKRYAQERKAWSTQGWQGGLKIAAVDSQNTAATWQATQVADFLKSAPQQISQQMATSFVDALQGKKTDFQALSYQMANWLIQKQLEGMLTQLMPKAIEGLMWLLGVEYTGKTLAAQTAALIGLTAAEQEAVLKVRAAEEAAAISKGGGSGGGWLSSVISGIGSVVSGLFGGGGMNLSLGDLSSGAGSYSAYNVSPSGGYNYIPGSAARPMAEGAIVSSPTYALIGEGREPEIVAPLSKLFGDRGGSTPPQVNVNIYPPANTEARSEQQPNGDIDVFFDQMAAKAYNRRGALHKAINSGGGATKR